VEGSKERPLLVGVGTSGRQIVESMQRAGFDATFSYASFSRKDIPDGTPFFDWRNPEGTGAFEYLGELGARAEYIVVFGGLGGASGSYLLPKVCKTIKNDNPLVLGVALLPFKSQQWMEFTASTALSRLQRARCGLVVVDREQFLEDRLSDLPLEQVYATINDRVSAAFQSMLSEGGEALRVLFTGQSVMQFADPSYGFTNSLASILRRAISTGISEIEDMYLVSGGNRPITFDDSRTATAAIRNIMSPDSRLHYINCRSSGGPVVALVGRASTLLKLRIRDPLEDIFGSNWIDPEPESGAMYPVELDRID
jgi:cell division GTPase FtsZ